MKTCLIAIDGVVRKLMGGAPIAEGIRLYRSLATTGQVVLLLDDWKIREQVNDWLELNGLVQHAFLDYAEGQSHLYLANRLRRQGYEIDMVVEPDPWMASEMIKSGLNTLLFTHRRVPVVRPGQHPPPGVRQRVRRQRARPRRHLRDPRAVLAHVARPQVDAGVALRVRHQQPDRPG
jgi:hypothetical protein